METAAPELGSLLANIYGLVLFGAGLICLGYVISRHRRWRLTSRPPGAWPLSWLDFGLFVFAVFVVFVFSAIVGDSITGLFESLEENEDAYFALAASLSSVAMQLGFVTLFWGWRQTHQTEAEGPLNPSPMSLTSVLRVAMLFILATYPVVLLVSLGTQFTFETLNNWGLPFEAEEQAAVALFLETENPWVVGLLVVAAVFLAPFGEELVFRAGLYRFLLGKIGKPAAVVLSSMIFGAIHFNLYGMLPLATLGVALCLAYDLSGNIRVPIIMHMLFNAHTVILLLAFPDALPTP